MNLKQSCREVGTKVAKLAPLPPSVVERGSDRLGPSQILCLLANELAPTYPAQGLATLVSSRNIVAEHRGTRIDKIGSLPIEEASETHISAKDISPVDLTADELSLRRGPDLKISKVRCGGISHGCRNRFARLPL
jgi:hypothetical protein